MTCRGCPSGCAAAPSRRTVLTAGALVAAGALAGCRPAQAEGPAPGTRLGSTSEVPVAAGTVFPAAGVVVTQPVPGTYQAFSAVCTHQGCIVREVRDGTINCACHGSRFALSDGAVVSGPAQRPLTRLSVTVDGSSIVLA